MAASVAVHGLIIATVWPDTRQRLISAGDMDVVIEILKPTPEKAARPEAGSGRTQAPAVFHAASPDSEVGLKRAHGPAPLHADQAVPSPPPLIAHVKSRSGLRPPRMEIANSSINAPAARPQSRNEDELRRQSLIRGHLEAFKFYPASARRRGIEGDVDVSFSLTGGGMAEQVKVRKGSGYAVLDRAALMTVARAQPFPVGNGRYRFRLRFRRL